MRFLTDSVLLPEQDMKQKDTGEQDIMIKGYIMIKGCKGYIMIKGCKG